MIRSDIAVCNSFADFFSYSCRCSIYNVHVCRIIECLMEKLDSDKMTDECEERLMEIQYFVSRDFKYVSSSNLYEMWCSW